MKKIKGTELNKCENWYKFMKGKTLYAYEIRAIMWKTDKILKMRVEQKEN